MAGYDFRSPRLYVKAPLEEGASVALDRAQAHYLGTVLRLKSGDRVLVFNGSDVVAIIDWDFGPTIQPRMGPVLCRVSVRAVHSDS